MTTKDWAQVAPPARGAGELEWWATRQWTGGVELGGLDGLECFAVRTRNTTYEITVLSPGSGDVLVRGGRFFPVRTRVRLAGSSLGGSFLKQRAIYPGFSMEFQCGRESIVTTAVESIVTLAQTRVA